jgi:probable phosphoglycerate mutase
MAVPRMRREPTATSLRSGTVSDVGGPQLLVVRHGQTEWSRTGRHTGRTDVGLTDQGLDEARSAARTLEGWNVLGAYSSPLQRARQTAELVAPDCGIVLDDDLVEWDYGSYEGRSTPEIRETISEWSVWTHAIEGGETVEQVGERADRFLRRVLEEVPAGNVAVFSHGHLLAVLIARWCELHPLEGRRFALATATVSLLGWHREDRVIRALNHRAGNILDPPFRT